MRCVPLCASLWVAIQTSYWERCVCPRFLRNVKVPALSTECGIVILTHAAQFALHVPTFFSLTDRAQCIDMCNTKFLDARRRCGIIMITIGVPILGDRDAGQECPSPSNSRISKLLPSTVGLIGTYSVGQLPNSMAFDGTNLWVTRAGTTSPVSQQLKLLGTTHAVASYSSALV